MSLALAPVEFDLSSENIAIEPVELGSGLSRGDVRMMVVGSTDGVATDAWFRDLPSHLGEGDVLVVNRSATLPAAVAAVDPEDVLVHFASPVAGGLWAVELRRAIADGGSSPGPEPQTPAIVLPGRATVHLLTRHASSNRLWLAKIEGVDDVTGYLNRRGRPIRYTPGQPIPLRYYQTIFAREPGSAEMPSAARPFTHEMLTHLTRRGVVVVPLVLHSGLSSYEVGERPAEEPYDVPASTATVINARRSAGGRVIAVGTTVVRALETVVDDRNTVHPGHGLTDVIVTPQRGVSAVDGLITGWHEPRSSHLDLLGTFLDREKLSNAYAAAISSGYRWHEFGDSMLILP